MEAAQLTTRIEPEIPWASSLNPIRFRQLIVDPYAFMKDSRDACGPVYRIHGPGGEQVVLTTPESAKAIFALPPEHTESFGQELFAPFIGENNMLAMSGERHRLERKMLMPHFHGQRMREYAQVIVDVSTRQLAEVPLNQPFAIQKVTQQISLEVIIRAVFGLQSPEQVKQAFKAVVGLVESMRPTLVFMPSLRRNFFGLGPWARFRKNKAILDKLLEDEIDRRRAEKDVGSDILSMMLTSTYEDGSPLTRDHIRDELVTLLFAGHETTAVVLAWVFFWLHRDPNILEKLRKELLEAGPHPSAEIINRLPYLDAICNESLRLYPVVPVVMRKLKVPMSVPPFTLPIDSKVAVAIGWLHHDPAIYPDPYTFRPERFLERSYGPQEFLPFGGGNRRCLGAAFAQYEMKLVIATMLAQGSFQLVGNPKVRFERRNAIIGPHHSVKLMRTA